MYYIYVCMCLKVLHNYQADPQPLASVHAAKFFWELYAVIEETFKSRIWFANNRFSTLMPRAYVSRTLPAYMVGVFGGGNASQMKEYQPMPQRIIPNQPVALNGNAPFVSASVWDCHLAQGLKTFDILRIKVLLVSLLSSLSSPGVRCWLVVLTFWNLWLYFIIIFFSRLRHEDRVNIYTTYDFQLFSFIFFFSRFSGPELPGCNKYVKGAVHCVSTENVFCYMFFKVKEQRPISLILMNLSQKK